MRMLFSAAMLLAFAAGAGAQALGVEYMPSVGDATDPRVGLAAGWVLPRSLLRFGFQFRTQSDVFAAATRWEDPSTNAHPCHPEAATALAAGE
jgi:hypothetical protein